MINKCVDPLIIGEDLNLYNHHSSLKRLAHRLAAFGCRINLVCIQLLKEPVGERVMDPF